MSSYGGYKLWHYDGVYVSPSARSVAILARREPSFNMPGTNVIQGLQVDSGLLPLPCAFCQDGGIVGEKLRKRRQQRRQLKQSLSTVTALLSAFSLLDFPYSLRVFPRLMHPCRS